MDKSTTLKPELLLPAGNPKAFYAAMKGGANAVYLGLQQFNARKRAGNFTAWELAAAIKMAHQQGVKVYVTLNTVIRNNELNQLIDTLYLLDQLKPDAIIVQDWGIVYLIQQYFPGLTLHASTQMVNHNSLGAAFAHKTGFKRIVLARELTKNELKDIALKSNIELEVFIHGALCYSFSGMCLFSSFLGGASANRGQCAQPCRRNYSQNNDDQYYFSLKDNQLIEHLPFLKELKISSLKVEGRLKATDYVFQVAKSYRKALDHPEQGQEAQEELLMDLGREKTDYFYGKELKNAITHKAINGLFLGTVNEVKDNRVYFTSKEQLKNDCKLRFRNAPQDSQIQLTINRIVKEDNLYSFKYSENEISIGDEVYLVGIPIQLPTKLNTDGIKVFSKCPDKKKQTILNRLQFKISPNKPGEIYLRIDDANWLPCIPFDQADSIIINLSRKDWSTLDLNQQKLQQNKSKILIELPKFIAEGDIDFYRQHLLQCATMGFQSFVLSHLSQKEILPADCKYICNENVYIFNDAAARFVSSQGASSYIYPIENDIVNYSRTSNRDGIIPMYFYPQLFYSRMPVLLDKTNTFDDRNGEQFRKLVRDGITIVVPENPVSFTQFKSKLDRYGYYRYLIDLSSITPAEGLAARLIKKLKYSDKIGNTQLFNFKRELK